MVNVLFFIYEPPLDNTDLNYQGWTSHLDAVENTRMLQDGHLPLHTGCDQSSHVKMQVSSRGLNKAIIIVKKIGSGQSI